MATDIIAALATAPGRAGVGVVRVSGPDLRILAGSILGRVPVPRHATLMNFRDGSGEALDRGIALYFQAPHSYTGEDVLELQGHGGDAVLGLVLGRCLELGARLAEPGEFTRRAFLNGRIDLVQAESVADLIEAASGQAARSAMRSLGGEFSRRVHAMVEALVLVRMRLEAGLDFPEEEGVDPLAGAETLERVAAVRAELEGVVASAKRGSLLRNGLQVVIAGRPNVGKSSLLNRLAGEEVAIVTAMPGTTRDALRERIQIDGVPIHVIDTAGLRETDEPVERLGIERTWRALESADLVLRVTAPDAVLAPGDDGLEARVPRAVPRVWVQNKIDVTGAPAGWVPDPSGDIVRVSALTGAGMDALRECILAHAGWQAAGEGVFAARARHLEALGATRRALDEAMAGSAPELVAESLRVAQKALSGITGEFGADDLLGEIFSRFCIGK